MQLSDSTGAILATVFGVHAETMFGIIGEYLKENTQGVNHTCLHKELIFIIHYKKSQQIFITHYH